MPSFFNSMTCPKKENYKIFFLYIDKHTKKNDAQLAIEQICNKNGSNNSCQVGY
jgi:hypothetical protein